MRVHARMFVKKIYLSFCCSEDRLSRSPGGPVTSLFRGPISSLVIPLHTPLEWLGSIKHRVSVCLDSTH